MYKALLLLLVAIPALVTAAAFDAGHATESNDRLATISTGENILETVLTSSSALQRRANAAPPDLRVIKILNQYIREINTRVERLPIAEQGVEATRAKFSGLQFVDELRKTGKIPDAAVPVYLKRILGQIVPDSDKDVRPGGEVLDRILPIAYDDRWSSEPGLMQHVIDTVAGHGQPLSEDAMQMLRSFEKVK